MLTPEMTELANRLVALIEADNESASQVESSEVREICRDLLDAANVDDLGGCPLCQG